MLSRCAGEPGGSPKELRVHTEHLMTLLAPSHGHTNRSSDWTRELREDVGKRSKHVAVLFTTGHAVSVKRGSSRSLTHDDGTILST